MDTNRYWVIKSKDTSQYWSSLPDGSENWRTDKRYRLKFSTKYNAMATMHELEGWIDDCMTVVCVRRKHNAVRPVPIGTVYIFNSHPDRPYVVCRPPRGSTNMVNDETPVYWQSVDGCGPVCYGLASEWHEEVEAGKINVVYQPPQEFLNNSNGSNNGR